MLILISKIDFRYIHFVDFGLKIYFWYISFVDFGLKIFFLTEDLCSSCKKTHNT